jgi:hypothetical protein
MATLWLVQTAPGRPDNTQQLTVQLTGMPRPFSFMPVTFHLPTGTLSMTVQGTVETGLTPDGVPHFYFTANRTVGFAPSGRPARDNAPGTGGSVKTAVAMPGPDEVLSFELPPLQGEGASLPDRFSIRVRVTQQPMQERPRTQ